MSRFADAFVAVCIVVIAISAGLVVWLQSGHGAFAGVSVTLALLLVLLLVQAHSNRMRDREIMERQIDDLARRTSHALGELSSIERRLAAIESGRMAIKVDDTHLVGEIEEMSTLLTQVAETVGALDSRVSRVERDVDRPAALEAAFRLASAAAAPRETDAAAGLVPAAPREWSAPVEARRATPPAPPPAAPRTRPIVPVRYQSLGEAGFIDLLKRSLEAQRLEVHLQPLVSLPSRKPVGYDVIARLRDDDGASILPADYWRAAERSRLIQAIDTSVVAAAFRVARRLTQRTKDLMLLVPLSTETLAGPRAFAAIERLAKANVDLNASIVFGFPLASALAVGPLEAQGLDTLRGLGYRLSLDQAIDLGFDAKLAASRGFRMVRAEVGVVLAAQAPRGGDIHPADLPDLLQRAGLDLIVGEVATEPQVLDLLDHRVRYAVGDVFGPSRPVRADVLAREAAEPPPIGAAPARGSATGPATARVATMANRAPAVTPEPPQRPGRREAPAPLGLPLAAASMPTASANTAPAVMGERRPAVSAPAVSTPTASTGVNEQGLIRDVLRRIDPRQAATRTLTGGKT